MKIQLVSHVLATAATVGAIYLYVESVGQLMRQADFGPVRRGIIAISGLIVDVTIILAIWAVVN